MGIKTKLGTWQLHLALLSLCLCVSVAPSSLELSRAKNYPPAGSWAKKAPAELRPRSGEAGRSGRYAQSRETNRAIDFSDQESTSARCSARCRPSARRTNGVVIYKGYVVAEFGDTTWVDPTYSVAKSMLATGRGHRRARRQDRRTSTIRSAQPSRTAATIRRSNAQVTWKMHLQQETEWEGNMWGKQDDFVGAEAFGDGERKPRERQKPGTFYEYNDVRINRLALSLLRTFKKPVPDVFRDEIMDPIGASNAWKLGSVPQQLRRHRRQEDGVGQRRHALGRRHVDQLHGTWRASATCGCAAASGATSRSCRRRT